MSTAKIRVVVSNLYDISELFGQPRMSQPKNPAPKVVPEQIFPVRILARKGADFFYQILLERC
jgi:hypothetical protein